MKSLLCKDLMLLINVVWLGLILLLLPYLFFLFVERGQFAARWAEAVSRGGYLSLMSLLLTAAFLGGNAFACEREDGSASFLAYLPPSRSQVALSKLVISLSILAGLLFVEVLVLLAARWMLTAGAGNGSEHMLRDHPLNYIWPTIGGSLAALGLSWLFSSRLRSSSHAVFLTVVVGFGGFALLPVWRGMFEQNLDFSWILFIVGTTVGVTGLLAGVLLFATYPEE